MLMFEDLISEDAYENLPRDPLKKFAELERICRRNLMAAINEEDNSNISNPFVRRQYMQTIAAAAEELGINGIEVVNRDTRDAVNVSEFIQNVSGIITKIRLRSTSASHDALTVKIANRTKGIIENELSKLRSVIEEADIDDQKRTKLLKKIEEFRTELHKERLQFAPSMAALAFIAAGIGGTTAFLADAPDAFTTIVRLIGQDKADEDAEVLRLEGPNSPKLIESGKRDASEKTGRHTDNEEIPF